MIALAILTIGLLVALWPSGSSGNLDGDLFAGTKPVRAHVLAVERIPCDFDPLVTCEHVRLDVSGVDDPTASYMQSADAAVRVSVGDDILVNVAEQGGAPTYSFYDFQRGRPLTVLVILFVAAVLLLGRWRGIGALAGLVASLVVITVFLLPALLEGGEPVLLALTAAGAIAFIALYLSHGLNVATSVALLGTFASLALTAILAWIFVRATELTGYTEDSAFFLQASGVSVDMRGIVLAGFVIGSLGVLDDMTVTQVSAVAELRAADPASSSREIYGAAVRIGRDHVSSAVNTLFLAYAGAALPLLLLFTQARRSVGSIATSEIVATEVVRSLVGSIGLVAAVPITTALAVLTIGARPDPTRG